MRTDAIGPKLPFKFCSARWDPRTLVNDLAKQQLAYYRTLSDFPTFGTGWLNRTEARHQAALAMIAASETSSA